MKAYPCSSGKMSVDILELVPEQLIGKIRAWICAVLP